METVLRVTIMFLVVLVAFRILGKRELTQMSPFEMVLLLFIPQLFSRALTRQDYSMTNALIAFSTLLTLVSLTSIIGFRSKQMGRMLKGRPTVLVENGRLVEVHLQRERISPEDIYSHLHKAGLASLDQAKWVILETDGHISVIPLSAVGKY